MFEQVVFAGGGHRCWWQAGFWEVVQPAIDLRPRRIAGVSAGAAMACMLHATDTRAALAYYDEVLGEAPRNAYWGNLLRRGQRVFPHDGIYRGAIRHLLGGEGFRRLMRTAPDIHVQFSRLPAWLGPRSGVAVGLTAYNIEKYWKKSLHPRFGRRLGFKSEVVRVQDCQDEDALISLIIASSCTPPFTPIEYRDGRATLDGGLVDNVPVDAFERVPQLAGQYVAPGSTLVLTTRRYPRRAEIFFVDGRLYVQPSQKVPVSSWDYASPARYHATFEQGRRDGEGFLARRSQWASAGTERASSARQASSSVGHERSLS